ncbi:MAG: isoprenylcysteine carboxylmethyltransferase family protein [Bacteriovorax sp.]|nr:isoprenylcysteine carboxylmethyltransferase family protein [Bacteriovorax sp.]
MNYLILFFYIIQRLFEVWLNAKNESKLKLKFKVNVVDLNEIKLLKLFHALWFFMLLTESVYHGKIPALHWAIPIGIILFLAQVIRFHTIKTLGPFWTVQVLKIENQPIISDRGLYRYIRHPNYLAVLLEFIFLPLLLGCCYTLVIGFVLKLIILKKRIILEEATLSSTSSYQTIFKDKKRFIPKLF